MRKIHRNSDKNNLIFRIIIVFVMIVCSISTGYSLLSTTLSVTGKGNLVIAEESDDLKVEYELSSWFNAGIYYYQIKATITNMTTETIDGWEIVVPVPSDVTDDTLKDNCWTAYCTVKDGYLHITNGEYNGTLSASGGSTSFGFIISTSDDTWSFSDYTINGEKPTPSPSVSPSPSESPDPSVSPSPSESPEPTDEVNVTLVKTSDGEYEGYYYKQYTVTVNNSTTASTTSWKFDLIVPSGTSVAGLWNVNYIEKDGVITISNGEWNGTIASDKNLSFTLQLKSTTKDYTPTVDNIVVTN